MKHLFFVMVISFWVCSTCQAYSFNYDNSGYLTGISDIEVDGNFFNIMYMNGTISFDSNIGFYTEQYSVVKEYPDISDQILKVNYEANLILEKTFFPPAQLPLARQSWYSNVWNSNNSEFRLLYFWWDSAQCVPEGNNPWLMDYYAGTIEPFTGFSHYVSVVSPVPEPSTILLFSVSLAGFISERKFSNSKHKKR